MCIHLISLSIARLLPRMATLEYISMYMRGHGTSQHLVSDFHIFYKSMEVKC